MSADSNVDRYVKDPSILIDLIREVIDHLDADNNETETAAMDAQLREISKAVEKLEKQGVSVPDVLRAEKTRLASALGIQAEALQVLNQLADDLGEILAELKTQLGRDAQSPQTKKSRGKRSSLQRTPKNVLRQLVIEALQSMNGAGTKSDVLKFMGEKLEGKLLPGDLEWRESTKDYAWQNNTAWERFVMVGEGILKSDSPRGLWELNKEHK